MDDQKPVISRFKQWMEHYFRFVVGPRHRLLTAISVGLTLLAVVVVATQWNINSDFKELLPGDSEAAQAMDEASVRVGSQSSLFAVVDSPDQQANREFAADFSEALLEQDEISLAHFHNDKAFFEQHKLLYVDTEHLEQLHEEVEDTIREEQQQRNPLYVDLSDEDDEEDDESVDTDEIEEQYEQLAHQDYREYLEAEDGYSLTLVIRFTGDATDLETTREMLDLVDDVGQSLEPDTYHEEMTLDYGGGLVARDAEYSSIVDDIGRSALFTLVGLFLVLSLYFRRTRAMALVLVPLLMAVLWTYAVTFLIFGELTTVSVFVFAILLGLGIDFSIHLLNGYDHLRLEGKDPVDALIACYSSVGKATVMGGITTFSTFVVLSFAQFRGLSQFGQVSAIGVVMMVLAVVMTLPALLLTLHEKWPHNPDPEKTVSHRLKFDRWFNYENLGRATPWMLAAAVAITAVWAWQLPNLQFEEDFHQIGQLDPPWQASEELSPEQQARADAESDAESVAEDVRDRAMVVRENIDPDTFVPEREQETTGDKYTSALQGQHTSTPSLLLTDEVEHAARIYENMSELEEQGELDTVRSLASIHAFMPGDEQIQRERLEVIADIADTLEGRDLEDVSEDTRQDLQRLEELSQVDEPIDIYDMPLWSKRMFQEAGDGAMEAAESEQFAFEYVIFVNNAVPRMIGEDARAYHTQVREAAETAGVDFRFACQSHIYTTMLDEIRYDGAKMLGIALVVVLLLLTLYFRSPLRAGTALIPLTLGAVWAFGFAAWIGLRLDFFNVVILPVIIGIGIDDGLHFYQRYLDRGRGSIIDVTHHVGAAVGMTTITSMVGFGGLAITDYAGLQSIGYLAIIGLVAAFLATVLVLPALLWLAERFEFDPLVPDHRFDTR